MCNFKIVINVKMWLSIVTFTAIFILFIAWTINLVKIIIKDIKCKGHNGYSWGLNIFAYMFMVLLEILFILVLLSLLGLVIFV